MTFRRLLRQIRQDPPVYCSGGRNYLQIYPNGDIYRCLHHKRNICNVTSFASDSYQPPPLKCREYPACLKVTCDRDWAIKWQIKNRTLSKIENTMYDDDIENITVHNMQELSSFTYSKVMIFWMPTSICNYDCPYCECKSTKQYDELSDKDWLNFFSKIKNSYEGGRIALNGGEPFIRKKLLVDVANTLKDNFYFTFITNLSMPVSDCLDSISTEKACFIASLHPQARNFNFDHFLASAVLIKSRGFHISINFVSYPEQLYLFDRFQSAFSQYGIEVNLLPWSGYSRNKGNVHKNTEEEIEYCKPRSTVIADRRFD